MLTSASKVKILPLDAGEAVRTLIDITERLIELMGDESRAVIMEDKELFLSVSEEKKRLADFYEQAAGEFKKRLNEFRAVDKTLINHLDAVQKQLGDLTFANMDALEKASVANS